MVPDPVRNIFPPGKVWFALSERGTILCNFEEEGKRGVWDEKEKDEDAGASGSQESDKTTEDWGDPEHRTSIVIFSTYSTGSSRSER